MPELKEIKINGLPAARHIANVSTLLANYSVALKRMRTVPGGYLLITISFLNLIIIKILHF